MRLPVFLRLAGLIDPKVSKIFGISKIACSKEAYRWSTTRKMRWLPSLCYQLAMVLELQPGR